MANSSSHGGGDGRISDRNNARTGGHRLSSEYRGGRKAYNKPRTRSNNEKLQGKTERTGVKRESSYQNREEEYYSQNRSSIDSHSFRRGRDTNRTRGEVPGNKENRFSDMSRRSREESRRHGQKEPYSDNHSYNKRSFESRQSPKSESAVEGSERRIYYGGKRRPFNSGEHRSYNENKHGAGRAYDNRPYGEKRTYRNNKRARYNEQNELVIREIKDSQANDNIVAQNPDVISEATKSLEPHPVFENRLFGKNPIWEALKVGRAMEKLYVAEGVEDASIEGILGIARREKVALQRVPRAVLDEMVPGAKHQGLVAELPAKDYVPLDTLVENAFSQTKSPLFILLDEVQDPHNLGAIIRTADCSGADGVVVLEHRAVGLTATVAKVSAGALEHMPVSKVTNLVRCIELLQQKGVTVIGADTEGKSCYSVDMRGPIALVIGNEGLGLRRLVHEQCDALAGIPLKGHVDSLNASVAAAVLMFEAVRQRQEI